MKKEQKQTMALSFKLTTSARYEIRSISLPSRPHPSTTRIKQELNMFKKWEASYVPTEERICNGLTRLALLYECIDDLLNLPLTQQALCRHKDEIGELLDGSIKLLDICGHAKDMVEQVKESVRGFQFALRRRKGDLSTESNVIKYTSIRKQIKKEVKTLIADLKQINNTYGGSLVLDIDHHLIAVIKILMEVSETAIFVLESLFSFFSMKPKSSRWSIVPKLMQKGRVACEEQQGSVSDLERVDVALLNLWKEGSNNEGEKMQMAQKRLEAMEGHIESMDSGLECVFRGLIRTRSLLLNIVSH